MKYKEDYPEKKMLHDTIEHQINNGFLGRCKLCKESFSLEWTDVCPFCMGMVPRKKRTAD
jgi:rRNA maturation endonuclease Nob1